MTVFDVKKVDCGIEKDNETSYSIGLFSSRNKAKALAIEELLKLKKTAIEEGLVETEEEFNKGLEFPTNNPEFEDVEWMWQLYDDQFRRVLITERSVL